jgi:hypothetical protein
MSNDRIRNAVLERFREQVEPLLRAGATVHVISHSWGTVVAYEGLRALDGRSVSGRAKAFFTVGSALSIAPVKKSLRQRDGRRPTCVQRWANLDAKGDVVGGPLKGRPFLVDDEFLNLSPVGCQPSGFGMYAPACAHSSYFDQSNDAANRDIFARIIQQ